MKKNHSLDVDINEKTFYSGEVFTLTINRLETYLIEHDTMNQTSLLKPFQGMFVTTSTMKGG